MASSVECDVGDGVCGFVVGEGYLSAAGACGLVDECFHGCVVMDVMMFFDSPRQGSVV